MNIYDLYGFEEENLKSSKKLIERALNIRFVAHDSMYLGGDYYRLSDFNGGNIILQKNFNDFEKEWQRPEFKNFLVLLYVNGIKEPDVMKEKILKDVPGITFLTREEVG